MIRNKARLVAQGHTQEEGIDYDEVFAPVARIKAIRLFLAYASFKDFVVYQMDVKSAFFYGKIEEEVYVCQPLGFEDLDFPDRVYKVKKALYRLHQDPIAWYETLSTYLLDNGFQRGKIDKTLFIKRSGILSLSKIINGEKAQLQGPRRWQDDNITDHSVRRVLQLADEDRKRVSDEAIHKELGDSLVRSVTIAFSLEQIRTVLKEQRRKKQPPTKYQQRKICELPKITDLETELVEGKEKRAGTELIQENAKKQKVEDDKETTELKHCLEIIPDEEEATIDAIL
ncbi:copia protein [Tanacetum coccineum]